jgi:hypothetical protein
MATPLPETSPDALAGSAMPRAAMGDAVMDHDFHAAPLEIEDSSRAVTDCEIARRFDKA